MPIHRLQEEPTVRATLADITCDSDGKIDRFLDPAGGADGSASLPLHELRPGEPYYLAMFLTGVYQVRMQTLQDFHVTRRKCKLGETRNPLLV
jgi:arginine decarboxylase